MKPAIFVKGLAITAILFVCSAIANAQLSDLQQPGTEFSYVEFGTSPSMTVFNGDLYVAYQANDGSHTTWITVSQTGITGEGFTYGYEIPNILTHSATGPTITVWNGKLWLAYTAENGFVYLTSSSDGTNFATPTPVMNSNANYEQFANSSPSLVVYNNQLWITQEVNGAGSATTMQSAITSDGLNFTESNYCQNLPGGAEPQTGAMIGTAVFNNELWFAFQAQGDWSHYLVLCSTYAGTSGTADSYYEPGLQAGSGVAASTYNGALYLAYKVLSGNNNLTITETLGSGAFESNVYSGILINGRQQLNPSTAVWDGAYFLTYTSNDSDHHMFVTAN